MISTPWYMQYESLRIRVGQLKIQFTKRCEALGICPYRVGVELWKDIVIRAVHESNWQEGIFVERGRTRELANYVFDDLDGVSGPHLDFTEILESHKARVVRLKRRGNSLDELATYNLSAAYLAITWIGSELANRQSASLAIVLADVKKLVDSGQIKLPLDDVKFEKIQAGFNALETLSSSTAIINAPITGGVNTEGLLFKHFLNMDIENLIYPMHEDYIHFLHRLIVMGITDPRRSGKYRSASVHVGCAGLLFPPPAAIAQLMKEYCKHFPTILPTTVKYDPIKKAAEVSHHFVRIHPYFDGNGRVSRLLMNLVLWGHHPPVYLKADAKGRHRYIQALHRADRGNIEPLACLIAMSLIEVYDMMFDSIKSRSFTG